MLFAEVLWLKWSDFDFCWCPLHSKKRLGSSGFVEKWGLPLCFGDTICDTWQAQLFVAEMVGCGCWWGWKKNGAVLVLPRAQGGQGYVGKGCGKGDFHRYLRDCSPSFTGLEWLDNTDGNTARIKQNETIRAHWAQQTLRIRSSYYQCCSEGHLTLIEWGLPLSGLFINSPYAFMRDQLAHKGQARN